MSHLLLLEDEAGFQVLLADALGHAGHTVVAARSGAEGLQCVAEQVFDLLLVDHRMPGLSGLQFLERFRAGGGQAPVIMMTAFADVPMVVEAMRLNAIDFLIKPFGLETLLPLVERCLGPAAL
jgi:two-component system, NtrC family, response regulator AtoC